MRAILFVLAIVLAATAVFAGQSPDKAVAVERHYCTEYGPFFIRFDPDKAAGVFAILNNNDLGSIVGRLDGRTLEGEWIEVDSRGEIRLVFSADWSRFDAKYNVGGNRDKWYGDWTGVLRPKDASATIEVNDKQYRCH